jgi:hypothetical protein
MQADRGHVRRRNDAYADSRLRFFAQWLQYHGFTRQSATALRLTQIIDLLGTFLTDVKHVNNPSKTKLTGKPLRNYVIAASD